MRRRARPRLLAATFVSVAVIGVVGFLIAAARPTQAAPNNQRSDTSSCTDRDRETEVLHSEREVSPASIGMCMTATVSTTVRSTCHAVPMIVMLNMDISISMSGVPLGKAKDAAIALVESLELDANPDTLVGVVTHGNRARTLLKPTNKKPLIRGAIGNLKAEFGDNLPDAIGLANNELKKSARRSAQTPLEYMVVFSDGGQDHLAARSIGPANSASSRGVQVVSMCSEYGRPPVCGAMRDIASEARFFFDIDDASQLALHFSAEADSARNVRLRAVSIVEHISPDVTYKPASASRAAHYDPLAQTLTFTPSDPETGVFHFEYYIRPNVTGEIVLSENEATFVDTRGLSGVIDVPTTTLTVEICPPDPLSPSPTPPPTPTPTTEPTPIDDPPTAETPQRSATSQVQKTRFAYLPIALDQCATGRRPVDTVLLIDSGIEAVSASLSHGHDSKNAIDLAREYADSMVPGDRVAVFAVGALATRMTGLTNDQGKVRAAIGRVRSHTDSRLDRALDAAVDELDSERAGPDHKRVIVVLSTGRVGTATHAAIIAAARKAREESRVSTFSIGLGSEPERERLIQIAGWIGRYVASSDPDAVPSIYREIVEPRRCKKSEIGVPGVKPLEPSP